MQRYSCATCHHHPVEREDSCSCVCHEMAHQLVDAVVTEYRNHGVNTADRLRLVGDSLKKQLAAKSRLFELTRHSLHSA